MKTSGSLRYINNYSLTGALQKYYEIVIPRASVDAKGADKVFDDHIVPYMIKHFQFQYFDESTPDFSEAEAKMFNRTDDSDQELINMVGIYHAASSASLAH